MLIQHYTTFQNQSRPIFIPEMQTVHSRQIHPESMAVFFQQCLTNLYRSRLFVCLSREQWVVMILI